MTPFSSGTYLSLTDWRQVDWTAFSSSACLFLFLFPSYFSWIFLIRRARRGVQTLQVQYVWKCAKGSIIIIVLDEYASMRLCVWMNSGLIVCIAIEYSDRVPGSEWLMAMGAYERWTKRRQTRLPLSLQTTTDDVCTNITIDPFINRAVFLLMRVNTFSRELMLQSNANCLFISWFSLVYSVSWKLHSLFFRSAVQEVNDRRFVHQIGILGKTEQFPLTFFLEWAAFWRLGARQHSRICRSIFKYSPQFWITFPNSSLYNVGTKICWILDSMIFLDILWQHLSLQQIWVGRGEEGEGGARIETQTETRL